MGYHYDPILCMNVPDAPSKAKDAKALDDARSDFSKVIALTKQIDEITKKYARKIDANAMFAYTDQIRNKVQYYIDNASRGWYDSVPAEMRDASDRDRRALESIKSIVNNIQRSSDVLHDFIVIKNTANQIQDKTLKAEAMKIVNSMASKIRRAGAHDSLDKAIKTSDRFTVWESDDYDDIYVSYENGTYVLYVDGRPQADGPQQRMIQLAKQEERMRD